jgi:tRNA uridine 5-carbamoylmethylation protein Kti12
MKTACHRDLIRQIAAWCRLAPGQSRTGGCAEQLAAGCVWQDHALMLFIMINGYPGAGKLTIARLLATMLDARLLDNHTLFNPANSLFARDDPLHQSLRYAVTEVVFEHLGRDTSERHLVLTGSFTDTDSNHAKYRQLIELVAKLHAIFIAVTVTCTVEENIRRLTAEGRAERYKLTDSAVLRDLRTRFTLLRPSDVPSIDLDTATLTPDQAADALHRDIQNLLPASAARF